MEALWNQKTTRTCTLPIAKSQPWAAKWEPQGCVKITFFPIEKRKAKNLLFGSNSNQPQNHEATRLAIAPWCRRYHQGSPSEVQLSRTQGTEMQLQIEQRVHGIPVLSLTLEKTSEQQICFSLEHVVTLKNALLNWKRFMGTCRLHNARTHTDTQSTSRAWAAWDDKLLDEVGFIGPSNQCWMLDAGVAGSNGMGQPKISDIGFLENVQLISTTFFRFFPTEKQK